MHVSELPEVYLHDSRSGARQRLVPIEPGHVRMYVCGMTVYDYCHVGHARVMVVFDMVVRWLRLLGYRVTYVRNITDIDDKIIRRAQENGEEIHALTERFIMAMDEDAARLGVLKPDLEPRATEHIDGIIAMVERLIERGHAYGADNGDIYFEVASFAAYGSLSGRRLEELQAGARVEIDERKRAPLDFVLWKAAKPGEPSWDSPWGPGRPGWHIECSVMSTCCLGEHFDLHGGGLDLQFPHHENELAQSVGANGKPFVNLWMHNGFVRVDDEKMSKSLGNFFTVRDVLERYHPEELRMLILQSHYRSPLNYSETNLELARAALQRCYTALRGLEPANVEGGAPDTEGSDHWLRFSAAMSDDFNTPEAFAVVFEVVRELNRARDEADAPAIIRAASTLRRMGDALGLLGQQPEAYLKGGATDSTTVAEIEALIVARNEARARRDWAAADRVRDELAQRGIVLEDAAGSTTWRRG
ncbi:MAG TPA: cysteine--tRNA ligase [Gammaproteobacteria bacterium]|nr:cysteine--tRNA ligase [Gammaproteobacteria bacterium]